MMSTLRRLPALCTLVAELQLTLSTAAESKVAGADDSEIDDEEKESGEDSASDEEE
jgi:hypothetical protein